MPLNSTPWYVKAAAHSVPFTANPPSVVHTSPAGPMGCVVGVVVLCVGACVVGLGVVGLCVGACVVGLVVVVGASGVGSTVGCEVVGSTVATGTGAFVGSCSVGAPVEAVALTQRQKPQYFFTVSLPRALL